MDDFAYINVGVQNRQNYVMHSNVMHRKVVTDRQEKLLWMVPKVMRKSIVIKFHDLAGHYSVDRTIAKIRKK